MSNNTQKNKLSENQKDEISKYISKISKAQYSRTQYFFWLLSGAEISILRNCPTDYNRQAGIGFTIFMTTVLAFCSGSYAGYYFGQSIFSAIVFGVIWSCLIFSIDRSMVITLKKDPTKENQKFWAPFVSRCVLAILIAFIISIPLELLIFRDSIDIHKSEFTQNKTLKIIYGQQTIQDIEGKRDLDKSLNDNISDIDKILANGEPKGDPVFDLLKNNVKNQQAIYDSLYNLKNIKNTEEQTAKYNVPFVYDTIKKKNVKDQSSSEWDYYKTKIEEHSKANQDFENFNNDNLIKLKDSLQNYIKNWVSENNTQKHSLQKDKTENTKKLNEGIAKVDTAGRVIDSIIKQHDNSFVFNFMVLEDLARSHKKILKPIKVASNPTDTSNANKNINTKNGAKLEWVNEYDPEGTTILFLLWLIRILFFTIEILPTISKIATPLGAYDRAIYRKEKDLELELDEKAEDFLKQQKKLRDLENKSELEQLKERVTIENELHKELLTEIANVQNQVARQKIEEFKQKHLKS